MIQTSFNKTVSNRFSIGFLVFPSKKWPAFLLERRHSPQHWKPISSKLQGLVSEEAISIQKSLWPSRHEQGQRRVGGWWWHRNVTTLWKPLWPCFLFRKGRLGPIKKLYSFQHFFWEGGREIFLHFSLIWNQGKQFSKPRCLDISPAQSTAMPTHWPTTTQRIGGQSASASLPSSQVVESVWDWEGYAGIYLRCMQQKLLFEIYSKYKNKLQFKLCSHLDTQAAHPSARSVRNIWKLPNRVTENDVRLVVVSLSLNVLRPRPWSLKASE